MLRILEPSPRALSLRNSRCSRLLGTGGGKTCPSRVPSKMDLEDPVNLTESPLHRTTGPWDHEKPSGTTKNKDPVQIPKKHQAGSPKTPEFWQLPTFRVWILAVSASSEALYSFQLNPVALKVGCRKTDCQESSKSSRLCKKLEASKLGTQKHTEITPQA